MKLRLSILTVITALALTGCFASPEPTKKQEPQEPYHEKAYEP